MFCKKCGSILVPDGRHFKCSKCGKRSMEINIKLLENVNVSVKEVALVKQEVEILPKTKAHCVKCNNGKAYYYMIQTRGLDESPTIFYTCTKCSHKWRDSN